MTTARIPAKRILGLLVLLPGLAGYSLALAAFLLIPATNQGLAFVDDRDFTPGYVLLLAPVSLLVLGVLLFFVLYYWSFRLVRRVFTMLSVTALLFIWVWLSGGTASPLPLILLTLVPWLLLLLCWVQGLRQACPRCRWVDGLYAKRVLREETTGSSTRETRYIESDTRRILRTETNTTTFYNQYCDCVACGHQWVVAKSK